QEVTVLMGLMQFECVPSRSVVSGRMGAFDSHGVLIPALTHPVHGGLLMAGPRYAGRLLNFLAISLSMPRFSCWSTRRRCPPTQVGASSVICATWRRSAPQSPRSADANQQLACRSIKNLLIDERV